MDSVGERRVSSRTEKHWTPLPLNSGRLWAGADTFANAVLVLPFPFCFSLDTSLFTRQLTAQATCTSNYVHCGYTHPVKTEAESLLPLPPATFHILVALADEDRHGYAVIKDVAARTGGTLKLSPGTLYRSVDRMVQQGLIREISSRPARDMDHERRRYYRITAFGRDVAMAEARRLAQMLELARAKGLAPRKA